MKPAYIWEHKVGGGGRIICRQVDDFTPASMGEKIVKDLLNKICCKVRIV